MTVVSRLPVFWLTVRQFRGGKAIRVVAFFAAISIVLAAIYLLGSQWITSRTFLAHTYFDMLAPTVIPLATLVLATSALGNEISDHTLPYLVLKPIGRLRIVLEKYVGVALVTGLAFLIGLTITWGMVMLNGDYVGGDILAALLVATGAGVLAYGALFLLVSLVIPRALLVGIVYVLLWESLLARFIPGIKLLSIRQYAQSVFVGILPDSPVKLSDAVGLHSAIAVLAIVVVLSLILATFRLTRMDVD